MNKIKTSSKLFLISFLLGAVLYSCKPLIALYDANAYSQAVSIKVDLENLVDTSSTVDYSNATAQTSQVNTEIQKAMEYDRGREKDSISTKQYEKLYSDAHSYQAFLKLWQSEKKVSKDFAHEYQGTMDKIMDEIIKLENGKNKSGN
jgi:hypothetical protein